ncbi:MAG: ABC transporter ATP-binding protein/permease [Anaerolineae bacterium]|nr:ABC transporter ATP-binding protein/permease [Anaerolineae bacterium]
MFHGGGGGNWMSYIWSDPEAQKKRGLFNRALLWRVSTYARPYTRDIILMLFMILVTTGLGLLTPLIFRDLIDHALQPPGDPARLNWLAAGLIAIPVINGTIGVFQRRINARIGEGVIYDLRVALYAHLQKMSLRFFTGTRTGELISRLNNDVIGAQNAISNTIVTIITNIVTVIAILLVMLSMEWRLTILGVLVLPFFIIIARRLGSRLREIARTQMQNDAQMNAMMTETLNISGALLVKLFGRTGSEVARFEQRAGSVREAGIQRAVMGAQFFRLIGLVSVVGTALVYWIGGHLVLSGAFTVGTIVAFGTYLTQLYGPLQALTNAPVDFATSVVSFERVFEIIDLPHDIAEPAAARHLDAVRGAVAFQDVHFRYDSGGGLLSQPERWDDEQELTLSGEGSTAAPARSQAREQALQGITFSLQPGELVALVGPSGAGKTTLTYLIPRLYDPTAGRITLDGHDLRELSLATLAQNIGMVTQETYLFHDTIRQNLLYARQAATPAELEAACRAANIHDFIAGLPDGYDTVVGERGYRLSGGEKQRLALARVILKDPRILVLDEATSSLDSQSEALIQEALAKVMQGRTSIVIAHRLSTVMAADRLLVLDRGVIVEQGRHAELLAQGGLYATLYETQFKAERQTL